MATTEFTSMKAAAPRPPPDRLPGRILLVAMIAAFFIFGGRGLQAPTKTVDVDITRPDAGDHMPEAPRLPNGYGGQGGKTTGRGQPVLASALCLSFPTRAARLRFSERAKASARPRIQAPGRARWRPERLRRVSARSPAVPERLFLQAMRWRTRSGSVGKRSPHLPGAEHQRQTAISAARSIVGWSTKRNGPVRTRAAPGREMILSSRSPRLADHPDAPACSRRRPPAGSCWAACPTAGWSGPWPAASRRAAG